MSETNLVTGRRILAFATVVEISTGLLLIVAPAIVVALLLGSSLASQAVPLGRLAGCALLALGVACWPSRRGTETASAPFGGMLLYNTLVALYLAHLGTLRHLSGLLLWPAVAVHAFVALSLVWTWRSDRRSKTSNT